MSLEASRVSWDECSCCGGELPLVDNNNGSSLLPPTKTKDGYCPGHVNANGTCGAYEPKVLEDWLNELA